MNDTFQCGDEEALVAFLYEECEPRQREAIAAHLARCAACAEEIGSLEATRTQLASWTPPAGVLGFRVSATTGLQATGSGRQDASAAARSPSPGALLGPPWWQRPLPAWAQAAAAMLIFAAGLMLGAARDTGTPDAATQATARPVTSTIAPASGVASLEELARVERRLRDEITQLQNVSASPALARGDDEAVIQRVEALIAESEERQRQELAFRTAALARDFDQQRRVDFQRVQQFQGTTGAEVREQREAIRYVMSALSTR